MSDTESVLEACLCKDAPSSWPFAAGMSDGASADKPLMFKAFAPELTDEASSATVAADFEASPLANEPFLS